MKLNFDKLGNGLVPAVAQDFETGKVLMVGFMNQEAFEKTLNEGRATYYSRSRKKLWTKGESSGNVQNVREIFVDCDNDTVLIKVEQVGGAACHLGYNTCFFTKVENGDTRIVEKRVFNPDEVYGK